MKSIHVRIVLLSMAATFAAGAGQAEDRIAVSVKHILDARGERSLGKFTRDENVQGAIDEANEVLERSRASWRLELIEVVNVRGASDRFDVTGQDELKSLEVEAHGDPHRFGWRDDAVNVYVVNSMPSRGASSFPGSGELIAVNNVHGFRNGGAGWLHEICHFLSLTHTYECYLETGCDPSACTGEAASHAPPRGRVRCDDICPEAFNVMGFSEPPVDRAVLTPCQLAETDVELHGAGGLRSHVLLDGGPDDRPRFRRGDSGGDGRLDMSDALAILRQLFLGAAPGLCADALDVNDDGVLSMTDSISLLRYLFLGGFSPPEPWSSCGVDPTADGLDCFSFPVCGAA